NLKPVIMSTNVQEADIDVPAKVNAPQDFVSAESDDVTIDQILAQRARSTGRPTQMPSALKKPEVSQAPKAVPFVEEIKEETEFLESNEELPSPQEPLLAS